jgi:hypothetical protein
MRPEPQVDPHPTEGEAPREDRAATTFWQRSDPLNRQLVRNIRLICGLILTFVAAVAILGALTGSSTSIELTVIEVAVLIFTLLFLAVLAVYSSSSFSVDALAIIESFQRGTADLIERSEQHWEAQSHALESAIASLTAVVEVETSALRATESALQVSSSLLELEHQRDALRIEADRLRRQRIRPAVAILPLILHPGPIAKDVGVRLFNQGEAGRRIEVKLEWGLLPNAEQRSRLASSMEAFTSREFDFCNIDDLPDSVDARLAVEMDDVDGGRYHWDAIFSYSRNRGLVLSDPTFTPSDWQYPSPVEVGQ